MRKIETVGDVKKQQRRKQMIVGGLLLFVMIMSTIGYAFQSQPSDNSINQNHKYNGYEFVFLPQYGLWVVNVSGIQYGFRYLPDEINDTASLPLKEIDSYANKPLYIYSESGESEQDIYLAFDKFIERRQYACLSKDKCTDSTLPIKTCQDNFIIIEEAKIPEINQVDNCVYIKGPLQDLPKITDEFLYKVLNIKY